WINISMIMSGIDPQTKKFTEPPEQIKREIAALKANKSIPEADKKEDLAQLEAELKNTKRRRPPCLTSKFYPSLIMVRDQECLHHPPRRTFHMNKSLENRIRERAYEIWTAHGCMHGQAEQHWLAAEQEMLATSTAVLADKPNPKKKA